VQRWTDPGIKHAVYRRVYHKGPGFVYLTGRGQKAVGPTYRARVPARDSFEHLYWIAEVRMKLEEEMPPLHWISERAIQAKYRQRFEGQKLPRIPDGILIVPQQDSTEEKIEIEVQISKPSDREVEEVLGDQFWSQGENNPVRYYVSKHARGVVRHVYIRMMQEGTAMRSRIEIIDLEAWLQRPLDTFG